jgi:hypothetical protein
MYIVYYEINSFLRITNICHDSLCSENLFSALAYVRIAEVSTLELGVSLKVEQLLTEIV